MLEQAVQAVVRQTLAQSGSHLELPAVLYAAVDSVRQLSDTYEAAELELHSDEGGGSYRGHIVAHWYEYRLHMVDRFGNRDESFPPIPGVRSQCQLPAGAVAAVALPYGELTPVILGEVRL